ASNVTGEGLPWHDVVALAQKLAPAGGLWPQKLLTEHKLLGGTSSLEALTKQLLAHGYMQDQEHLYPKWEYLSGDLWDKYDRVPEGPQGERQREALLAKIKPAVFADIEVDPRLAWVPIPVVRMWLDQNQDLEGVVLERRGGVIHASVHRWGGIQVLDWLNHMTFSPYSTPPLDESKYPPAITEEIAKLEAEGKNITNAIKRRLWSIYYLDQFRQWIKTEPGAQDILTNAYNRAFKGFVLPEFDNSPIHIERWTKDKNLQLRPHQIRAVKARAMTRGGILALAVGAGKTFTSLALIALGRQEGWIKRPVVVVPAGIVWQWADEVARVLPDFRVGVVGSVRYIGKSGKKKGKLTSRTAKPEERAREWLHFQAGLYDMVLLTDTSLGTTRISEQELAAYARDREAMMRSLYIERQKLRGKHESDLSERDRALQKYGAQAWVAETLELKNRVYDPGVAWSELGIDFLVYDETGNIRRTWSPAPREFGMPKYMGTSHKGSKRGWQADFRAALVRMNGGGVLALSGTVGENSPAEPYNLLHFIDPQIMERVGITDVEQFISRYVVTDSRLVMKPTGERKLSDAVVGFKNLNELRTILFTWGNFVSHEQAGIKLPSSEELLVEVEMSDAQRNIYDFHRERAQAALKRADSNSVFSALSRMREVTVHELLGGQGYSWSTAYGGIARKEVTSRALDQYLDSGWVLSSEVLKQQLDDPSNAEIRGKLAAKLQKLKASQAKSEMFKVEKLLPEPGNFSSGKIEACAERVAENLTCGHIVFVESTAAHAWLTEMLVKHGVKRERIAVINGYVGDVSEITRKFNGSEEEPRSLDVVITNSKGTRGVNLQRQTCMLHNLDLRWTPADMEQRRGRIDRFGNTMPEIFILFYFANDSFDSFMFDILAGKGSWRDSLFLRDGDRSINPAAQLELGQAELFMLTARNKEEALAFKKQIEAKAERERLAEAAFRAHKLFSQAAGRIFHATKVTGDEANRLRQEARGQLDTLEKISTRAWPWTEANEELWAGDPRREWIVGDTPDVPPVYPGMMIKHQSRLVQVGAMLPGQYIGMREDGQAKWRSMPLQELRGAEYAREAKPSLATFDVDSVARELHTWHAAHEPWVMEQWTKYLDTIVDALRRTHRRMPLFTLNDGLTVAALVPELNKRYILPPTRTAWEVYRTWAPISHTSDQRLEAVARSWFGRELTLPVKSVIDRKDGEISERELECTDRILKMKPGRVRTAVEREFERLQKAKVTSGTEKLNLAPGINVDIEMRAFASAGELREQVMRTLYREFLTRWHRLAHAQVELLNNQIVSGIDAFYEGVDEMYGRLTKILGSANARLIQVCAQLGTLDKATSYDVSPAKFVAKLRSLIDPRVAKVRVTREVETFVPVAHDQQFVKVQQIDINSAKVAEETFRAPGNLFALQSADKLHERIPLKPGSMYMYVVTDEKKASLGHGWVNVHPDDVEKVFGRTLETR
ncbi:MAG: SNF2-related protein, partial [Nannocystaceae bacterium]